MAAIRFFYKLGSAKSDNNPVAYGMKKLKFGTWNSTDFLFSCGQHGMVAWTFVV